MNDPDFIPEPPIVYEPAPTPVMPDAAPYPVATPDRARRSPMLVVGVIGFLILALGEAWLFARTTRHAGQAAQVASLGQQVDQLSSQMATLEDRLTTLANRPMPKPAPVAAPPPPPPVPAIPAGLDRKIAAMRASLAALSATTLADHATVTQLQDKAAGLPKLVAHAQNLAAIAQASVALQNGAPLGHIPNAPAALTRYETNPPPTLAALKASYPGYARKAEAAGGSVAPGGNFWRTIKGRVEGLVTIRHNADVLVGSRASGILGAAQTALDQDNLPAAIDDLKRLPAASRTAMAPWTAKATHLLAARAALATLAGAR